MKTYSLLMSTSMVVAAVFILAPCVVLAQVAPTVYLSANDIVYSFTPPGPKATFATLPAGTSPQGLVFDTGGNLFVLGGEIGRAHV